MSYICQPLQGNDLEVVLLDPILTGLGEFSIRFRMNGHESYISLEDWTSFTYHYLKGGFFGWGVQPPEAVVDLIKKIKEELWDGDSNA